MIKWNPIETAPRDGTPFLAFRPADPDGENYGEDENGFSVVYFSISETLCEATSQFMFDDCAADDGVTFKATHWMPLPEPPEDAP